VATPSEDRIARVTTAPGSILTPDPSTPFGFRDLDPNFTFPPHSHPFGIDVSQEQGAIDWPQVAQSKVAFAFIKALVGNDRIDTAFQSNWQGAQQNNIRFGALHVLSPHATAQEQAAAFLSIKGVRQGSLPVAVALGAWRDPDSSDNRDLWSQKSASDIVKMIRDFSRIVTKTTGRAVIIQVSKLWWDTRIGSAGDQLFSEHELWINDQNPSHLNIGHAQTVPGFEPRYWQFTSAGQVPGIIGAVNITVRRR